MALGPIGNAIYVNQQMASVSSEKTSHLNRLDMQNFTAAMEAGKAQQEVDKVRPAEKNHKVDEDREHQKQENDQEQRRSPKKQEEEEETKQSTIHHLDIKV
jgi:hypothetical protein